MYYKLCDNHPIDSENGINYIGLFEHTHTRARASGQGYIQTFRNIRINKHTILLARPNLFHFHRHQQTILKFCLDVFQFPIIPLLHITFESQSDRTHTTGFVD